MAGVASSHLGKGDKNMQTVLVVDDDTASRYFLECLLRAHAYEVVSASNGQGALDKLNERVPDLIISDILMPVMDGFTLCRQVRQDARFRSVRFVFYTATYTDSQDEQFGLSLGADLFLMKPVEPDALLAKIRALLDTPDPLESPHPHSIPPGDTPYLMQYNQTLVRKLEQKVAELEEANRRLLLSDHALASSLSGVVFVELSGGVTYVNAAFCRTWGRGDRDCLGMRLPEFFVDESGAETMFRKLVDTGGFCGELEAKHESGSAFWVQVAAHVVCDSLYKPVCVMLWCTDVTDHRRLQEAVQRSARLESLSVFAGGIAHDFNNLLTCIFGSMEAAYDANSTAESRAAQYPVVRSAFEKARDLSRRLMAFAQGSPHQRRLLDIRHLVDECCALALSGSSVQCTLESEPSPWLVEGDSTQLSQVLDNILINARQAMSDRGAVRVSIRNITDPGRKAPLPPGDYVRIRVEDEGPGIPQDILPKVCDPFFTTKASGTGLGLASSYAIVRDHGGHLGISSTVGMGAIVDVWLVATRAEGAERARKTAPARPHGSGRILVMDDDELIRNLARRLLGEAGYDVSVAADGEAAVEAYQQALAQDRPFGLVMLDLTVRSGLAGQETLARLRAVDAHVVALACSARSDEATVGHALDAGFVGVLPKPYMSHELFSMVKGALGVDPERWSEWLEPPSTQRSH